MPDVTAALATNPALRSVADARELLNAFSPGSQWDRPGWIKSTLSEEFDFKEIEVKSVARTSVLNGIEEWADTIPWTLGMMINKCWSAEDVRQHGHAAKQVFHWLHAGEIWNGPDKVELGDQ